MNDISIVEAKPRPIAVVRVTTALSEWPKIFMQALDKVYAAVAAGRVRQDGQNVMVYRARQDGLVDIECGVETDGRFEDAGDVVYSETPSGAAVTTTHAGAYGAMESSYRKLARWSEEHGRPATGTRWEIYGDWSDDPAQLRTEIFSLLQR